jgi:hypothetical protein
LKIPIRDPRREARSGKKSILGDQKNRLPGQRSTEPTRAAHQQAFDEPEIQPPQFGIEIRSGQGSEKVGIRTDIHPAA